MSQQETKSTLLNVEELISSYISEGKLASDGTHALYERIKKDFGDVQEVKDGKFDLASLQAKIDEVVWDKKTVAALEEVVKHGLPLEKFLSYHPHIPRKAVEERVEGLRGPSHTSSPAIFMPGLGRLGEKEELANLDSFELPVTSFDKPFKVPMPAKNSQFSVLVLNGPNIGIKHDRRLGHNPVRKALADAERRKDIAVIVTNPINIDTKKAGGSAKVFRALVSGRNVNIKVLDPDYQAQAQEIINNPSSDLLVYETFREVFENILAGWAKVAASNNSPEYNGPIFVVFGRNEEELIAAAAYWEVRYWTMRRQNELEVEIKLVRSALARAIKEEDLKTARELEKKLSKLLKEKSRTIISNINTEDIQRTFNRVRAFVAKRFEQSIPNCKVIGQGTTYLQVGTQILEIHIPDQTSITDSLLANYCDHYGPKVLRRKFADGVVICHPYALNYRFTAREVDSGGKRRSSKVHVAPVVVDGDFLRESLHHTVRRLHPLSKLVFREQFAPGVLRLNFSNGLMSSDFVPVSALGAYKKIISDGSRASLPNYSETKFIWIMIGTDPHWGARSKEYIWSERLKSNLGVCEAAIEMMRRSGLFQSKRMPIHMFGINDDPTQGNHYETHKQPDPHEMSYAQIEKKFREFEQGVLKGNPAEREKAIAEFRSFGLNQFLVRGLDWQQAQLLEVFFRHLQPNVDFFDAVLTRAKQSGLVIKGMSDFESTYHDSRDIGVINMGSGNHFASTVDNTLTEGVIYALWLIGLLSSRDKWRDKFDALYKLVKAPLHGNEHIGWGTIQIPNGYEWGLELRSAPARLSSWGDTLLGAVRNDERRGNYSRIMDGKMAVKIYGDKHFFGAVACEHTFYHMCAAGTHTDLYGERGFPPNNTGVSFVGLPVNGPDSGPILIRTLSYDQLANYFSKPFNFDWEGFLPNPA